MNRNPLSRLLSFLLLLLAACAANPQPQVEPGGDFAPDVRNQPTQPAPAWVESAEAVTLDNVTRIARLGRLDAASSTPSTVFAYAISPDSTRLAGLNNEQLIAWNLVTGEVVFSTARQEALWVFYSPDKTELFTLDSTARVTVYNADVGGAKTEFEGHPAFNGMVAYYPDEGWLALGGLNGEVKVWDTANRQSLVTIRAHNRQITALAFSPDGGRLATAGEEGNVQVWDWRARVSQQSTSGEIARRLAFSPDGSQLAIGADQTITLWPMTEGEAALTLDSGRGGIRDVMVYSPDGRYLVNGGAIPALTVWETSEGTLVNRLPGMGGDSTSAAFLPDSPLLATSVLGGAVTLWDMTRITDETMTRADLDTSTRQILYVDWTSDGRLLTLFDASGPVHIWGIGAPAELDNAGG
jgi:WD40 repeat protein